jgi:cation:H+ antiporter
MNLLFSIIIFVLSGVVIYFAGSKFTVASSNLGDYFRLPRSVKGATFDAISSSFPELMVAVFSILLFKKFELGLGTISGSALFNLLIIPAICVFISPVVFKVNSKVISRDAIFYIMSIFLLLISVFYFSNWNLFIVIFFICIYLWYVFVLRKDSKLYKKQFAVKSFNISLKKELTTFIIAFIIIGIATYFLTYTAIYISEYLKISPVIIGFTIVAIATSIPDAIISIINAKKGDINDAISNVFGSNIVDILIGLSIPVFLAIVLGMSTAINFTHIEIIFGLLGSSILILYFLSQNNTLNKKQAIILFTIYILFLVYVIFFLA